MEKYIKDVFIENLNDTFGESFSIEDFPPNIDDYELTHSNGAILVKSTGMRVIRYFDPAEESMNPLATPTIGKYAISFKADILVRDIQTFDTLLEFTQTFIQHLSTIDIPDVPESNCGIGKFVFEDSSEPMFDEIGMFIFRTINFSIPLLLFFGE